jgi:uncharacterized Zn finger protein
MCSVMSNQSTAAVLCPSCGGAMSLARVLPKFGPHPELRTFKCEACGEVDTRAVVVAAQEKSEWSLSA